MSLEGTAVFGDKDGSFCEEKYVQILTSVCPGLTSVLYQNLSSYANVNSLLPLSKIYFKGKLARGTKNPVRESETQMEIRQPIEFESHHCDSGNDTGELLSWDEADMGDSELQKIEDDLIEEYARRDYKITWNEKSKSAYLSMMDYP